MKIMMFGHDGSLNRGCEAIVRSTSAMIKDRIEKSEIILASGKPETDKMIKNIDEIFNGEAVEFNPHLGQKIVIASEVKLLNSEHYALGKIYKNVIDKIDNIDILLSIGGDNYCYGEQPGFYEINRRVKKYGKKLVLWGCSIGEEDMSKRKLNDLKNFDLILARETLTYDMLKNKGLTNVKLVADPAFTMDKEELPLPIGWKENDTIGLNFSPLILSRNKKSDKVVKELIRYILESTGLTIALTPHVMIENNNDFEILNKIYEEFKETKRVIILPNNLNAIQYKGYIARMRAFIGARTHATIAAYSNSVPTMVLGYSVKSRGIAKDLFGYERLVLGIDEISDLNKLKYTFDEMINDEKDIRNHLNSTIPRIKDMSYKSVEYLKELMNK
ncbi:polysaccharide pyruvyl transferase family protein [Clostridium perfringens]|uniref:polysaccharide pyruvyl transferase family protein n=1 Tax=Clostridium perfringens TaxID=1502 RepID=UPI0018E40DB4|nr:polysaccharide pyruvyl transferase family protein [Clostridium perfringens]MBI5987100.1 polysaccharide pyruvyl transferase family protein [Clostridium perfringens]MDK0601186.1 polysaccharide pyruvyl transferase family protein [Clostridium perfringens]MDK0604066.1 polysaccharide pyruvyl transferase family protein [Clostridium perfringens]MDM0668100.1 polysaccharide pyruvyl transferase family protein [Clostridium perfringens]MDM0674334.1 polysaccharide pyruvyl transferase family protein [Clos